jgi:hypothetical protein
MFQKSYPIHSTALLVGMPAVGVLMPLPMALGIGAVALCFIPLTLVPILAALWGLGGKLVVEAGPGFVNVARKRIGWTQKSGLSFPPNEVPVIEVRRYTHYRNRTQGALVVRASTGQVELAPLVAQRVLDPVCQDLREFFGRRP